MTTLPDFRPSIARAAAPIRNAARRKAIESIRHAHGVLLTLLLVFASIVWMGIR